jgi:prepilin-type N-terminal cleavage/methylation domain-containing protein
MRGAWRATRRTGPGLTLIELLMAIALTGVLLALLLPLATGPASKWDACGCDHPAFFPNEAALAERGFIGVQLAPEPTADGYARIRALVAGSPAHQAGAWPGDAILRVDGRSTRNRGMKAVVQLITRGRPGSHVRLTLRRAGAPDTRELRMVRGSFYDVFLPGIAGHLLCGELPGTSSMNTWSTCTVPPPALFPGRRGPIRTAVFSADGKVLSTVDGDNRVRLWEVGSR